MQKKKWVDLKVPLERITWDGVDVPISLGAEWLEAWQDREPGLDFALGAPLTGTIHVERHGESILVRGTIRLELILPCSRCLERFPWQQEIELLVTQEIGQPEASDEEVELHPEDLDVDYVSGDELDLEGIIKEQILLALPLKALCREECAGLCRSCGANLNIESCTCAKAGFHQPFAALQKLKE